jgi:GDP-D-mannose dehydratase
MKRALILGITGQDGSYLAEFLLGKSYELHGVVRRASTFNTDRLDDIYADPHEPDVALRLHFGDSADGASLRQLLEWPAHWCAVNYREAYGLFICNGILPGARDRCQSSITNRLAGVERSSRERLRVPLCVELGFERKLYLGNLEARRD